MTGRIHLLQDRGTKIANEKTKQKKTLSMKIPKTDIFNENTQKRL